ncbi:MAG TPA: DUF1295 domain-containing protein [Caulobacteraceae bacterium]|nr:DUF1295 domain-containing protein [Caulobacteraceae bacterium]
MPIPDLVLAGLFLLATMSCAWIVQRFTRNVGWVDVFWTLGVGVAGAALALFPKGDAPFARQALVASMAAVWSLRLGLFVAWRVATGPEDRRYVEMREDWGGDFQARLAGFVLIQAPVGLILAVSIMLAARNPRPGLGLTDLAGAALWLLAVGGEALADDQLRRFKADPASHGRICDRGLWAWSRHPNYFFEWLGWLAYPVIAWPSSAVYAWGWATWVAPVLMFLVLDRGTGVPPLEAHLAKSRGQAFADYRARVSRFFPAPPRKHPT